MKMNFLSFFGKEGMVFKYQNMVLEKNCSDLNINTGTFFQKYFLS